MLWRNSLKVFLFILSISSVCCRYNSNRTSITDEIKYKYRWDETKIQCKIEVRQDLNLSEGEVRFLDQRWAHLLLLLLCQQAHLNHQKLIFKTNFQKQGCLQWKCKNSLKFTSVLISTVSPIFDYLDVQVQVISWSCQIWWFGAENYEDQASVCLWGS